MRIAITKQQYCVSMTVGEFERIIDHEANTGEALCDRLESIDGVSGVEYDGHYGPHVWFDVDTSESYPLAAGKAFQAVLDFP